MANWISYIKDDLGSGDDTRDGMITNGPTHGVQLSQELPPLVGFTTIGSAGTLHVAGTIKLDGQLKDGDDTFGSSGQVLSSDGTDTRWVSSGSLAAGAASQVAINDDSNANAERFITFVDSSSGNNSVKTDSVIKYNPSTNLLNLNATASGIKFGPGEAVNDDAHIEWLGGSNAGHLRISTSDDGGSEYIQFGDYDNTNRGGTFSEWLRISRSTGTFTGTFSATTFSGSGASLTSLNATNISSGTINAARVPTLNQDTTGSAATLTTARDIGGVSFDGSAAINLPGVNEAGNQNTSGNAATATVLATTRAFSISGDITANAINFNGSDAVALSATIDNNAVDKNCMANEAVGEPELHISNGGTNGQFLQKQSGNSGGLTWATVTVPSANTLSGSTLASGVTASSITSLGTLSGVTVQGTVTVNNGNTIELKTSSGNIRGYIQATETDDAHLIIATSGNEDISFRDGGTGGGVNMRIRGDGNVFVTGNCTADSFTGDLDASWITSGTLGTDRIPDLAASKITSGTLNTSRIPNLAASKITSGTLGTARIPNLAASKITSGTIADARLSSSSLFVTGMIMLWSGAANAIPSGWVLCNGSNGTPNLQDKFVVGAGSGYSVGNTGGAASVTLTTAQLPSHSHTTNNHRHSFSGSGSSSHSHDIASATGHTGYNILDRNRGTDPWTSNYNTTSVDTESATVSISISGNTGYSNPSTNNTGSGNSHENRPPYYALCYIMKT